MTLTVQQRGFLAEAEKHEWVSARMFAGASKPKSAGTYYPTITLNSAQAVLRRLARRGLLDQDERNPAIFRITDAGREALGIKRGLDRYEVEDRGYETPCWIWQGSPEGSNGYGRLRVGSGQRKQAHVAMYERSVGSVPDGLELDHLCRVPLCINPAHLEPVTGTENVRRGDVAKLSAEQAAEIRAFRDEFFAANPTNAKGEPRRRFPQGVLPELAARYGVSEFTIIHVLQGRTWR